MASIYSRERPTPTMQDDAIVALFLERYREDLEAGKLGSLTDYQALFPGYETVIGDVFALPIRDRWGGLETEGLGLAVLEASAAGLPVVVGRSGGTPSAVLDGTTGHLVDGKAARGKRSHDVSWRARHPAMVP